jgi:hypothetical protein
MPQTMWYSVLQTVFADLWSFTGPQHTVGTPDLSHTRAIPDGDLSLNLVPLLNL